MKIERARLRDTPVLAWTAARAFAAEFSRASIRRRAHALYLMHLYSVALVACGSELWHWERKAVISIEHKKASALWKRFALATLCAVVFTALTEMHPRRSGRKADAILQWRKKLPGREAYKVSYLAMYPQTREGLAFARAAIARVVPAGAPLYTEARSEAHKAIDTRRGFRPLAAADGTSTLAPWAPARPARLTAPQRASRTGAEGAGESPNSHGGAVSI